MMLNNRQAGPVKVANKSRVLAARAISGRKVAVPSKRPQARRFQVFCQPDGNGAAQTSVDVITVPGTESTNGTQASSNGNGATSTSPVLSDKAGRQDTDISAVPLDLVYTKPDDTDMFWTKFKLAFALPWRRFPKDSILTFKLEGEISDQNKSMFDPGLSIPQLCSALQKAAYDPRVKGIAVEISPLAIGYAKLQEIRRYISFFRESGKFTVAFLKQGGEKEYYIASAFQEIYSPPSAYLSLKGFVVGGTFLRGVLDKVGVEPQVQRIGDYKSAGDQLLRKDMSPAQREQLQCILDDTYTDFVQTVAKARGKAEEQVKELLDAGIYDLYELAQNKWLDGIRYEDELVADLKKRVGVPEDKMDKPLRKVGLRKVASVRPSTYEAMKGGKKKIVVLRTAGAILGKASSSGASISPDVLIPRLRALASDKNVAAVVLRVDSPGGDAFASDLMWREVCKLAEKKPVIASMADVAASGGYYISMAANKIVAEPLTVTGSIGVVTGKFNLAELYEKIGYSKELLSKGRYAELQADNRPFNKDEEELFGRSALHAYRQFRDKAAASRRKAIEELQAVAQGRVWTGRQALEIGLVDALGGVHAAVQLARQAAGIEKDERVTVLNVGSARSSPLALLSGGATAAFLTNPAVIAATVGTFAAPLLLVLGGNSGSAGNAAATSAAAATGSGSNPLSGVLSMLGGNTLLNSIMSNGVDGSSVAVANAVAAVQAAGVQTAMGPAMADAVAAAQSVTSVAGVTLAVDAEALGVQAAGSAAVMAAATSNGLMSPSSVMSDYDDVFQGL